MTTNSYLQAILDREKLTPESPEISPLQTEKDKIKEILTDKFGTNTFVLRYGGSKAKDTMILSSYDLDVICYFKHENNSGGETLKEIYYNVKSALEGAYKVQEKNSALRLLNKTSHGYTHVDVVPGRFVDGRESDAFLYRAKGEKERLKTNLDTHISHIRDSNVRGTIRLLKFWKELNKLDIPTFVLELLVIQILEKHTDSDGLDTCLKFFWETLRDTALSISIVDPANTGNDLSDVWNNSTKSLLRLCAERTLSLLDSEGWRSVFEQKDTYPSPVTPKATKPWCKTENENDTNF